MERLQGAVALVLALLCGACINAAFGTEMSAADYDQSCTTDDDCVEVHEGKVCQYACVCGNAAIRRSELARYNRDYATAAADCPPPPPTSRPCDTCPDRARCSAGTCAPVDD